MARSVSRVRTRNRIIAAMGKGDKRTRKGKIYKGSYGKKRPQRVKKPKKS
jgi:30S ribosomal protein S31